MDRSAATTSREEFLFRDGFGDRLLVRDSHARPLHESLVLRAELTAVPSFEFALNQRLAQLADFDHPAFVKIHRLVRISGGLPRLSLMADYCGGTRLTDVLAALESSSVKHSLETPLFLVKEILDAIVEFHRQHADVAHGALAPDRVILVDGKVRIADYVLGLAIDQLRFTPERYWKELRVAVPSSAGATRVDRRTDIAQAGMIALALFAGRELRDAEHMGNLGEALMGVVLPESVQTWLLRALHLDPRRTFVSAAEARQGLEAAIIGSGVRPMPLEMSSLNVRKTAVKSAVTIRTASPKPLTLAARPAPVAVRPSEAWTAVVPEPLAAKPSKFTAGLKRVMLFGALGVCVAGAFTAAQFVPAPAFLFSQKGTLVIETNPSGVALAVDGTAQGVTPLTMSVPAGPHQVELRGSGKPQVLNLYVSRGDRVAQYIEFRAASRGRGQARQ